MTTEKVLDKYRNSIKQIGTSQSTNRYLWVYLLSKRNKLRITSVSV